MKRLTHIQSCYICHDLTTILHAAIFKKHSDYIAPNCHPSFVQYDLSGKFGKRFYCSRPSRRNAHNSAPPNITRRELRRRDSIRWQIDKAGSATGVTVFFSSEYFLPSLTGYLPFIFVCQLWTLIAENSVWTSLLLNFFSWMNKYYRTH